MSRPADLSIVTVNWKVADLVGELLGSIAANKEDLAVLEAKKLGIPVIAVLDTNSSPDGIDYPIPGNDDAARAIALYCDLVARAALDGMAAQLGSAGVDIGALEEAPIEDMIWSMYGSFSTIAAAARCFSAIASNEMSCEASVNAKIWPVSSVGMNPLGMIMNR